MVEDKTELLGNAADVVVERNIVIIEGGELVIERPEITKKYKEQ